MIDLLVLAFLALLLVRGWARGFVREGMDLIGLVFGTILAFRLGPPVGVVVAAMASTSDEASRLIGGLIVFVVAGVGAAIVTRMIERRARLPGLNLVNRAGGAGLAVAWGVFLATLLLTLGVVLPMPPAIADSIDDSAVARTLTDPDGFVQDVFSGMAGDQIVETMLNLRRHLGVRQMVVEPGSVVELPPADPEDLASAPDDAQEIFRLVNRARVAAGADPLAWSSILADVGELHAREMYTAGYFAHRSPLTGDVGDRLEGAGVVFRFAGENLALAATVQEVHGGLMDSPGHRANIESDDYRRVGIAVVRGPLGLMTVQVFTG